MRKASITSILSTSTYKTGKDDKEVQKELENISNLINETRKSLSFLLPENKEQKSEDNDSFKENVSRGNNTNEEGLGQLYNNSNRLENSNIARNSKINTNNSRNIKIEIILTIIIYDLYYIIYII